jgi:hypothetical protein
VVIGVGAAEPAVPAGVGVVGGFIGTAVVPPGTGVVGGFVGVIAAGVTGGGVVIIAGGSTVAPPRGLVFMSVPPLFAQPQSTRAAAQGMPKPVVRIQTTSRKRSPIPELRLTLLAVGVVPAPALSKGYCAKILHLELREKGPIARAIAQLSP